MRIFMNFFTVQNFCDSFLIVFLNTSHKKIAFSSLLKLNSDCFGQYYSIIFEKQPSMKWKVKHIILRKKRRLVSTCSDINEFDGIRFDEYYLCYTVNGLTVL